MGKTLDKKRIITVLIAVVLIIAIVFILVLRPRHLYTCRITLTDESGKAVENLSELEPGTVLNMDIELSRHGKEASFDAYGLEMTMTNSGVSYNDDGVVFNEAASVSSRNQVVAKTQTLSFIYMDLTRVGVTLENPTQVGRCTLTVDDPENAEINLTTALIYPVDNTDGYEIYQSK